MAVPRAVPHVAMRPLWRCRNCGTEWPCEPARLSLLSEYQGNRTSLIVYLSSLMAEAYGQLGQLNPDRHVNLMDRFVTWARRG
ncbi:hypothetical protein GA0074694_3250 [Micromonospora inyonensis]|uniref:Flavin reductase n=2 Tax=Micromonospora inyonensis TaxID=47866 RepID=A0A1C6RY12_9ACTN|nr:flavin reductase [Micromonospora inyonensis]SCL22077.1 hypothetical protein GA0074694_3250 [Micromonospora inyonensis]